MLRNGISDGGCSLWSEPNKDLRRTPATIGVNGGNMRVLLCSFDSTIPRCGVHLTKIIFRACWTEDVWPSL